MRNKKKLLIEQLERKLEAFENTRMLIIPSKGWIHTIRTALNMTLEQLGNKLKITRQGAKKIEENESKGSITINSLKEVAEVLELKFVYGFIPKDGSIEKMIDRKSKELAKKVVSRTNQNMKLENQGIGDEKVKETIEELAQEIKREMKKSLWD